MQPEKKRTKTEKNSPTDSDKTLIENIKNFTERNQYDLLIKLLAVNGARQIAGEEKGWTMWHHAVHIATAHGKIDTLQKLLGARQGEQCPGQKPGYTMWHYAVGRATSSGQTDTLQELLGERSSEQSPGQKPGYTMWHYAVGIATSSGQTDTLQKLLGERSNEQCPGQKSGYTMWHYAIHYSASFGQTDTLQELLGERSSEQWPGEIPEWTMWHYAVGRAASSGQTDTLQELLGERSSKQWPGEKAEYTMWHYAIHYSAAFGQTDTLLELLSTHSAEPWPGRNKGWTNWHYAIFKSTIYGKTDTLQKLLDARSSEQCPEEKPGFTMWHYAISRAILFGKIDTLQNLLSKHSTKELPNRKEGFTMWHFAIEYALLNQQEKIYKYLLENYKDTIDFSTDATFDFLICKVIESKNEEIALFTLNFLKENDKSVKIKSHIFLLRMKETRIANANFDFAQKVFRGSLIRQEYLDNVNDPIMIYNYLRLNKERIISFGNEDLHNNLKFMLDNIKLNLMPFLFYYPPLIELLDEICTSKVSYSAQPTSGCCDEFGFMKDIEEITKKIAKLNKDFTHGIMNPESGKICSANFSGRTYAFQRQKLITYFFNRTTYTKTVSSTEGRNSEANYKRK